MSSELDSRQNKEWQILHDRITVTLDRFGKKNPFGKGDYWLVDDNWGWFRHQLEVQNPKLFQPHVIKALQALLTDFPDWDITVRPNVVAPDMGLIIYSDEIIDELQREYLPPDFRQFVYEGARPWKKKQPQDQSYIFRRALKQS